jgi:hypothetical protein
VTARLLAEGRISAAVRPVDAHAECEAPGRCGCGCDYSRGARCNQCGRARRPDEVDSNGECHDRANCAAAILAGYNHGQTPPQAWTGKSASELVAQNAKRKADSAVGTDAFRTPTASRKAGRCECCGEPTKGGRFRMGHDARLTSMLLKAARTGDDESLQELATRWPAKVPEDLKERSAALDLRPGSWALERAQARWGANAS